MTRLLAVLIAVSLYLGVAKILFGTLFASAQIPGVSPMWNGGFDVRDGSQYYQHLAPVQGRRVFYDSATKLHGNYSARMELRPGDTANSDGEHRNQYRGINPGNHYFHEGQDLYFHWSMYIDPSTTIGGSFSSPWRALVAWPSVQDGAFSPMKYMLQRNASGGYASPTGTDSISFSGDLGVSGANDIAQWTTPAIKGQWYEFITHWKFSSSASTGVVEHWMKKTGETGFAKQTFKNGSQTLRIKTLSAPGATSNLRMGIYRNPAFTTVDSIHYDDMMAGSSFSSVGGTSY